MGVLTRCTPRADVLKGDLNDAIFAADFGDLITGKAPEVYAKPRPFFDNTHPAAQLKHIVQAVFGRLNDPTETGATIRLSTGFGGGKTHTLMALWHLARNIADPGLGTDLLPAADRPKRVTVAAIDAGKAGDPVFLRHNGLEVRSLWGELAFRLGGEELWRSLGGVDNAERQPDEALVESWFPEGPVLLLLDELVVYMAGLSDRGQGNILAFLNKLASITSKRPQTVLVVTDPAKQVAYAQQTAKLNGALVTAAAAKLDEVLSRRASDFDPIGDESAQVIVRRLLERREEAGAQAASALYHNLYERVDREAPGQVPPSCASPAYAERIVQCYPFHPRLLDTARDRIGVMPDFQQSRGVLRMFARLLRDVWQRGDDLELITAGDVNWSSESIQGELLQRLNRGNFRAAISADIEKHAAELDADASEGIHRRVASALLLESLPLQANSGLDPAELALATLRPDEAGPEPEEALGRLMGVCWHTYPMAGGRGWQFRYEPNIIKQIEERTAQVPPAEGLDRVRSEAQGYFKRSVMELTAWPRDPGQVPERAELQLALCDSPEIAREVCAYADHEEGRAPMPRQFINAIVAVTAAPTGLDGAVERARRLLAAEQIEREHKTGDESKLVRDQLQRVMPELRKSFRLQTCRAFETIVLAGNVVHHLTEQYLANEENVVQAPAGQERVMKFLQDNRLIYSHGDALDPKMLVDTILSRTTPLPEHPGAYTAKAVHEAILGAPNLQLVPDRRFVLETLLRAVREGRLVVRKDGSAYDAAGCVAGPEGKRSRDNTRALTGLPLDDEALVAATNSEAAQAWLKEDEPDKEPDNGDNGDDNGDDLKRWPVSCKTWDEAVGYAAKRPLVSLTLLARGPADAKTLSGLAQPLGANSLTLGVNVGGQAKDGGRMDFLVEKLKPNHPTDPLKIAQTLFTALEADGARYEATLSLSFGEQGRSGLQASLQALAEQAADSVTPSASFGPEEGTAQ